MTEGIGNSMKRFLAYLLSLTVAATLFVSAGISAVSAAEPGATEYEGLTKLVDLDFGEFSKVAFLQSDRLDRLFHPMTDLTGGDSYIYSLHNANESGTVAPEPALADSTLTYPKYVQYFSPASTTGYSTTRTMVEDTLNSDVSKISSTYMSGPVTVEFWVNVPTGASGGSIISVNDDKFRIFLQDSGGNYKLYFKRNFSGGDTQWITSNAFIVPDIWTHVVMTFDASEKTRPQFYANGQVQGCDSPAVNGDPTALSSGIMFANRSSSQYARPFRGRLGSAAVYAGIATAQQAEDMYNNTRGFYTADVKDIKIKANGVLVEQDKDLTNEIVNHRYTALLTVPANAVIELPVDGVDTATMTKDSVQLVNIATGEAVDYTPQSTEDTYTIVPNAELVAGERYQLRTTGVTDGTEEVLFNPVIFTATEVPKTPELLTASISDGVATATVETSLISGNPLLAVALYQDNRLVDIRAAVYSGEGTFSCQLENIPADLSGYELKAMLWDSSGGMVPLCNPVPFVTAE